MYKYLLLLTLSVTAFAYEKADAFIVTAHPQFYKVLSPVKMNSEIGLIIQNETQVKILGKLVTDKREIKNISIKSRKSKSVLFKYNKSEKYYFIPISPPFQRVELLFGERSYEVPSKRKN